MRAGLLLIAIVIFLSVFPVLAYSNTMEKKEVLGIDTTKSSKEQRKENRKLARKTIKPKIFITGKTMYADLNSSVGIESADGLISVNVGLERHLGLDDKMPLFSGSFIYRITPRSSLFSNYYGLKRTNSITLEQDIVFLDDTIKKGSLLKGYFNTQVFGLGYLLTLLSDQKSFLGAYFNAYWISLKTGIDSEVLNVEDNIKFQAPLPNFGIVAAFDLKSWLSLSGSFGMFFINIEGVSGSFHDINALLSFKPVKWLGLDVGYQIFDVSANFPLESSRAIINYNYRGPTFGITARF